MMQVVAQLELLIEKTDDSIMVCRLGPTKSVGLKDFQWIGRGRPEPIGSAMVL